MIEVKGRRGSLSRASKVEFLVQLPLPYLYSAYIYWWTRQPGLERIEHAIPFMEASRFKQFSGVMLIASFIAQGEYILANCELVIVDCKLLIIDPLTTTNRELSPGVGFLIGAIFSHNYNISIFVTTIFMLFNFLFAGFFIRISDMGPVEFLTRFSFIRFSFEAMLLSVYGDDRCLASAPIAPTVSDNITMTLNINLVDEIALTTTELPQRVASYISMVLYQFELDQDQAGVYTRAMTWLLIHLIGWRLLTYLCLWWKVSETDFNLN